MQTSLISADSGEKQVLWLKHNEGRSEEAADTFFFPNISLGYKSGHVDQWLAAPFIHTHSGRAQKILFSTASLDPRGGKKSGSFLGE